jgi:hypothetical protein
MSIPRRVACSPMSIPCIASTTPEDSQTDFDFGYRAAFSDSFSLGANVFYQDNANDNPNEWNAGILTRARLVY